MSKNCLEKLEAEIHRQLPRLVRELRLRSQSDGGLRRLPLILEELLDQPFAAARAPGMLALS